MYYWGLLTGVLVGGGMTFILFCLLNSGKVSDQTSQSIYTVSCLKKILKNNKSFSLEEKQELESYINDLMHSDL